MLSTSGPGLAVMQAKRVLGVPVVVTFHALGRVRQLHQAADHFPPERLEIEGQLMVEANRIIAKRRSGSETHATIDLTYQQIYRSISAAAA